MSDCEKKFDDMVSDIKSQVELLKDVISLLTKQNKLFSGLLVYLGAPVDTLVDGAEGQGKK